MHDLAVAYLLMKGFAKVHTTVIDSGNFLSSPLFHILNGPTRMLYAHEIQLYPCVFRIGKTSITQSRITAILVTALGSLVPTVIISLVQSLHVDEINNFHQIITRDCYTWSNSFWGLLARDGSATCYIICTVSTLVCLTWLFKEGTGVQILSFKHVGFPTAGCWLMNAAGVPFGAVGRGGKKRYC